MLYSIDRSTSDFPAWLSICNYKASASHKINNGCIEVASNLYTASKLLPQLCLDLPYCRKQCKVSGKSSARFPLEELVQNPQVYESLRIFEFSKFVGF